MIEEENSVGLSAGIWQEHPATGCKVWNAYPEPGETFTWDGPCKDGFVDGSGILEWFLNGKFKVHYEGMKMFPSKWLTHVI